MSSNLTHEAAKIIAERECGARNLTETEWQDKMLRDLPLTANARPDPREQYQRMRNVPAFRMVDGEPEPVKNTPEISVWRRLNAWRALFGGLK